LNSKKEKKSNMTKDPNSYLYGKKVAIVASLYKRHCFGTYVHPYGTEIAIVLLKERE
jgi:hypothetical protein